MASNQAQAKPATKAANKKVSAPSTSKEGAPSDAAVKPPASKSGS